MEGRRKQTRSETVLLQLQQQDHLFNICAPDVAQNWGWWNSFLSRKQCLPSVNYVIPIMCRKANLWQNYAYLFTEWRNYIYCLLLLFSTDLKLYLGSAQFSRPPHDRGRHLDRRGEQAQKRCLVRWTQDETRWQVQWSWWCRRCHVWLRNVGKVSAEEVELESCGLCRNSSGEHEPPIWLISTEAHFSS